MRNIKDRLITERRIYKTFEDCMKDHITNAIVCAWDESGLEFTHEDIKKTLEKFAKEYDVDKELDWAKNCID